MWPTHRGGRDPNSGSSRLFSLVPRVYNEENNATLAISVLFIYQLRLIHQLLTVSYQLSIRPSAIDFLQHTLTPITYTMAIYSPAVHQKDKDFIKDTVTRFVRPCDLSLAPWPKHANQPRSAAATIKSLRGRSTSTSQTSSEASPRSICGRSGSASWTG